MSKLIIVKYAEYLYPNKKAPQNAAVHPNSFTAQGCGILQDFFSSDEEAQNALDKMNKFNPTVSYGIVEVE